YLMGIGLGSLAMNRYLDRRLKRHGRVDRKNLFLGLQVLISLYVTFLSVAFLYLTTHTAFGSLTRLTFSYMLHPRFAMPAGDSVLAFLADSFTLCDVVFWPVLFFFVPTLLMGASFPLLSSLALRRPDREGATIGTVYFVNIVGNVLGGVVTGFVLLAILGTERTLATFAVVGILFILFVSRIGGRRITMVSRVVAASLLSAATLTLAPQRGELYAAIHEAPGTGYDTFFEEGIDGVSITHHRLIDPTAAGSGTSFIAGHDYANVEIRNYINGLTHGWRPNFHYHYTVLETFGFNPAIHDVLVVGLGAGSLTEVLLELSGVENLTLVELNATLVRNLKKLSLFRTLLADPRIDLILDDGRRYLQRTGKTFDLITLYPLRSTSAYSNNIFCREFYELAKARLNPGGLLLVRTTESDVQAKTVLAVFPYVRQYDIFLLASEQPLSEDAAAKAAMAARLSPDMLERAGHSGRFVRDQDELRRATAALPINTQWRPVNEYYLGLEVKKRLLDHPRAGADSY
ncbi:MAG: fused MFS/spermidine synthase, partial [Verrucomicrobia bacterium]|nr:fused MFS/spermidine synthase [Verrucomicrobiota bacterium]